MAGATKSRIMRAATTTDTAGCRQNGSGRDFALPVKPKKPSVDGPWGKEVRIAEAR